MLNIPLSVPPKNYIRVFKAEQTAQFLLGV
jgi:hypothetical protein